MKDISVEKLLRYQSFSHMLKSWKIIGPISGLANEPAGSRMEFEAENSETAQKSMLCFQAFPPVISECSPEGSEEDQRSVMLYHEAIEHARNLFLDCEFFECQFRHKNGYECVQRIVISIYPLKEEKDYIVWASFALEKESPMEKQCRIEERDRVEENSFSHTQIRTEKKEDFSEEISEKAKRSADNKEEQKMGFCEQAEDHEDKREEKEKYGVNRQLVLACVCLSILVVLLIAAYILKDIQTKIDSPTPKPTMGTMQGSKNTPVVISEKKASPEPEKLAIIEPEKTASPKPEKLAIIEPEKTASPKPEKLAITEPEKTASPKPEKLAIIEPEKTASPKPEKTASLETKEAESVVSEQAAHMPETVKYDEQMKARIHIGDLYILGAYEQNNEKKYGSEEIEWIVLAKDDEGILMISRYVLDCIPYSQLKQSVNWKDSFLRSWMNGTFYEKAFDEDEKNGIMLRTQDNPPNPQYGTSGCETTSDRVFALSESEARVYLSDENRNTVGTAYAREQGAKFRKESGSKQVYWWLRTPGKNNQMAMITSVGNNALDYVGNSVGEEFSDGRKNNTGVRPAIWLSWEYIKQHDRQQGAQEAVEDPFVNEKKEPVGTLIKKSVGIREKPDGKAKRIIVTQIGDQVKLLGWLDNDQGRWYQVEYKGHTGYLNSTMLEVKDVENLPEI